MGQGCQAMFSALYFCAKNFEKPNERKIIMDSVLSCCSVDDEDVPIRAYGILNEIAAIHYDKLKDHMQQIFGLTLGQIAKVLCRPAFPFSLQANEAVAKQAVEFWCTLCDEEIALMEEIEYNMKNRLPEPSRKLERYVMGALQYLCDALFQALVRKDSPDVDPDELTLPISAGVCLSLVSQTVRDEILKYAVPFIENHIMSNVPISYHFVSCDLSYVGLEIS